MQEGECERLEKVIGNRLRRVLEVKLEMLNFFLRDLSRENIWIDCFKIKCFCYNLKNKFQEILIRKLQYYVYMRGYSNLDQVKIERNEEWID